MAKKTKRLVCALAAVFVLLSALAVPVFADSSTSTTTATEYTAFPGATLRGNIGDNSILVQDFGTGFNASAQTTSQNTQYSWKRHSAYAGGTMGDKNFSSLIQFSNSAALTNWRITLDYVPPAYAYKNGIWTLYDPYNLLSARLEFSTTVPKDNGRPADLHIKGAYRRYESYDNGNTFQPEYVEYTLPTTYEAKQGSIRWMYIIPLSDLIVEINNLHDPTGPLPPSSPDRGYRSALWDFSIIPYTMRNSTEESAPALYNINFRTVSGDAHPVGTWHYYALLTDEKSYRPMLESVSLENVSPVRWLGNVLAGFFSLEIFPGFSFGLIFLAIVAFLLLIAVIKLFAGG